MEITILNNISVRNVEKSLSLNFHNNDTKQNAEELLDNMSIYLIKNKSIRKSGL